MFQKSSQQSHTYSRLGLFLLTLCLTCLLNTPAHAASPCAPPSFNTAPVVRFPVTSSPASIATADFNRDGRADLAVTVQTNNGRVALLLGAGDGSFQAPQYVTARDMSFPVFSAIEDVVAGDFNGDDSPDLAVSWNADEISVMLNNGNGTFGAPSRLVGGGMGPTTLHTADLNADGRADLILTNSNTQDVSIFLGTGTGTFGAPTRFTTAQSARSTAVADFNGDGKQDLAVAGSQVAILLGDGAGAFGAPTRFATVYSAYSVAAADFNADGKTDLVVGHVFFNQITVLFGTGTGAFTGRLDITTGKDSRYVNTGDFNRDGKADILVANRESDDVVILAGDGAGHFGEPVGFVAGYGPIKVAYGDFNGDGEPDVATANVFGNSVSILLGKGGGAFSAASSLKGPSVGPFMTAAGDFNSDGKPDLAVSDSPTRTITFMPGDGTGRFGARVQSPTSRSPFYLAAAHFDGDGKLDLVTLEIGESSSTYVTVMLSNGDGTFRQQSSLNVATGLSRPLVADFNHDGQSDVAASNNNAAKVSVLLGDGAGGLSAPAQFDVGSTPYQLTEADFNNDGKNDLAVANYFGASVSILLGDGAGGFAPALNTPVGGNAISVAAADFNTDGKQDIAVLLESFAELVVLTGNGNGTFQERSRRNNIGFQASSVRTGDYNGDGAADIAIAVNREDVVTILQGDGAGNFAGLFSFYAGAGPSWMSEADFNGDGKQDLVVSGVTIVPLLNTLGTGAPTLQLCPSNYNVVEGVRSFQVLVSRGGDTSGPASVNYTTQDNTANETSDYAAAVGTLRFAPGEISKSFTLFITDDAYAEPAESLVVRLTDAAGARLGLPASLFVVITDNETKPGPNPVTPEGFNSEFFVRQHYVDFLSREPDAEGLAFWKQEIEQCGVDAACLEVKRINVSAAFFLSIEFQETGYLAYRAYKTAYGDASSTGVPGTVPVIRLREFLADQQQIGLGVQVNIGDWQGLLEANKQAYMLDFVRRQRFADAYPASMTAEEFVARLDLNAGNVLTADERAQLVSALAAAPSDPVKRAVTLRQVADHATLRQAELNRAFVLMQYYGYLRRNPDDAPEPGLNFGGWNFWLGKLNEFGGNYVAAEMVKAFITSDEYRKRFGQ